MKFLRILLFTSACLIGAMAYGQMPLPPADDPWWQSGIGVMTAAQIQVDCNRGFIPNCVKGSKWPDPPSKDCHSTTMDGLPNCKMPAMTSAACLKLFPPDEVGGFCDWYGYSTLAEEDRFERARYFIRVKHKDGTGDTWKEAPDGPKPKSSSVQTPQRAANKAFWIGATLTGASASALWIGGNICRSNNGVEPCTEHYGSYNAWNGLLTGASVFAAPALFYGCRKENQNAKWCWLIPGIVIGANVGWGIHEARINHPEAPESAIRRVR